MQPLDRAVLSWLCSGLRLWGSGLMAVGRPRTSSVDCNGLLACCLLLLLPLRLPALSAFGHACWKPPPPGFAEGPEEPARRWVHLLALLCLLVHLGAVLVQMPANHGVKRNSPHDALLQGACRQARPEAKIYEKRLKNYIF